MNLSKKLVGAVLATTMVFSVGAVTASAAAASVHLTSQQSTNTTSNVYGTHKYIWGNNSSSSARSVYYIAKYKKGGIWYTDTSRLIAPGASLAETKTSVLTVERDWILKLNVKGANLKGCDAWGYIKNA